MSALQVHVEAPGLFKKIHEHCSIDGDTRVFLERRKRLKSLQFCRKLRVPYQLGLAKHILLHACV